MGGQNYVFLLQKTIGVGEELSYPYGDDKNLWWRNKACSVYFET